MKSLPLDGNGPTAVLEVLQMARHDIVNMRKQMIKDMRARALDRGDITATMRVDEKGNPIGIVYKYPDGTDWTPPPELLEDVLIDDNLGEFSELIMSREAAARMRKISDIMVLGKGERKELPPPAPEEAEDGR